LPSLSQRVLDPLIDRTSDDAERAFVDARSRPADPLLLTLGPLRPSVQAIAVLDNTGDISREYLKSGHLVVGFGLLHL
jgi:hypothetical protein